MAFRNYFRKDAPLSRSFISVATRDDRRARSRAGSDRLPRRGGRAPCPGGLFHRKFPSLVLVCSVLEARARSTGAPVNGHGWFKADRRQPRRTGWTTPRGVDRVASSAVASSSSPLHLVAAIRADSLRGTPGRDDEPFLWPLFSKLLHVASAREARADSFARRSACSLNRITNTPCKFDFAILTRNNLESSLICRVVRSPLKSFVENPIISKLLR